MISPPQSWLRREDDAHVLSLHGHVGIMSVDTLHAAAREAAEAALPVRVDCSTLEYLDCAAAQVLVALQAALARDGRDLALRDVPPSVARYLERAGLAALRGLADGRASGLTLVPDGVS